MQKIILMILILTVSILAGTGSDEMIQIETFNIRFFPCNEDGAMMAKYDIRMSHPPEGEATDTTALFNMLKELDIEVLGVEELVDPPLFGAMAKRHLGNHFEFAYAPSNGWQKVGFLYNSEKVQLVGSPQIYNEVALGRVDRLRPAFRGYFKALPDGFDFHVIVLHLKASPRGYDERKQQWQQLQTILADIPNNGQKDADIILLGDLNNVSKDRFNEFLPTVTDLGFFWTGAEQDTLISNYWQPNWQVSEIQSSLIDHVLISSDAQVEYVENSTRVGGLCAEGQDKFTGKLPDYYLKISDHCPVYSSFKVYPDND